MLLTVPDVGLRTLLESEVLLRQTWPGCELDVMMLLQVLRLAEPSLVEALAIGLVAILTPASDTGSGSISLAYRRAKVSAVAHRAETGERVPSPHSRLQEVTMLEVQDVAVEGRSAYRQIG
jgi:hypothetical protein